MDLLSLTQGFLQQWPWPRARCVPTRPRFALACRAARSSQLSFLLLPASLSTGHLPHLTSPRPRLFSDVQVIPMGSLGAGMWERGAANPPRWASTCWEDMGRNRGGEIYRERCHLGSHLIRQLYQMVTLGADHQAAIQKQLTPIAWYTVGWWKELMFLNLLYFSFFFTKKGYPKYKSRLVISVMLGEIHQTYHRFS